MFKIKKRLTETDWTKIISMRKRRIIKNDWLFKSIIQKEIPTADQKSDGENTDFITLFKLIAVLCGTVEYNDAAEIIQYFLEAILVSFRIRLEINFMSQHRVCWMKIFSCVQFQPDGALILQLSNLYNLRRRSTSPLSRTLQNSPSRYYASRNSAVSCALFCIDNKF